jgi:hypothetical protein
MRRALQLAAGRLVGAPPLHHGAPTAARHFADKVAEAGASADKPADPGAPRAMRRGEPALNLLLRFRSACRRRGRRQRRGGSC